MEDGGAAQVLDHHQRQEVLDEAIRGYARWGYQLTHHTGTAAQMVRPKQSRAGASCFLVVITLGLWLLVELLLAIVGVGREKSVYLEVDAYGNLHETHG